MPAPLPNLPSTRKSRTPGSILLLDPIGPGSSLERSLRAFAESIGATAYPCNQISDLPPLLSSLGNGVSAAILSLDFLAVFEASRYLHEAVPLAEIIFLCAESQEESFRSQLGLMPRIGNHWHCLDSESADFTRKLKAAYFSGEQRRTVRTTLDRFNARLAGERSAVDPLQLRKLVVSDRFLASVLESASDAVISVDTGNRIVGFNPAAVELFGISQQDALGRSVASLGDEAWAGDIARLLASGKLRSIASFVLARSTGDRHLEISTNPVQDEAGIRIAYTLMVRDVTERIQTEDALRKTEALAATGRLAATVSHEINNPLEAVLNLLYLLSGEPLGDKAREYLRLSNLELDRVSHIVKQTLAFYRNTKGDKAETFEAAEAIDHMLRIYAGKLSSKSIQVSTQFEPQAQLEMTKGDFQQIVSNLISNAIDASPSGGRIDIRSGCDERLFHLEVEDTGGGVPNELLDRIFTPFFTTKQDIGTGLGLWVSKNLAEKYGGNITTTNSPTGAIFRVELPCLNAEG